VAVNIDLGELHGMGAENPDLVGSYRTSAWE
jgi:hypothetical protein